MIQRKNILSNLIQMSDFEFECIDCDNNNNSQGTVVPMTSTIKTFIGDLRAKGVRICSASKNDKFNYNSNINNPLIKILLENTNGREIYCRFFIWMGQERIYYNIEGE